jgi:predicted nicotinamide N-methyase
VDEVIGTSSGDFPLGECRLNVGEREWAVLYTAAVLSRDDEARFLGGLAERMPYGVALWPAAIALAHEIALRADEFRNKLVLELGAGTGLPGIVAASLGARVTQTDRQEVALAICRRNGERNGVGSIEYRLADWTEWADDGRYDWVLGSDILYGEALHPCLRRILESNLGPGGRVLLADPYRKASLGLLEGMEADGWRITLSKWTIGEADAARPVGVYELAPPPG